MGRPVVLIALLLVAAAPVVAAAAASSPSPAAANMADLPVPRLDELDEVVVEGRRRREVPRSWNDYQEPFNFLAKLVGQFTIAGQVDLHGQGRSDDLRKVAGRANCLGFGSAPGVQCDFTVRWPQSAGPDGQEIPGGVSTLDPAVLLFGFEPAAPGVSFVSLDNRGIMDTAVGRMVSPNTMLARSKCVAVSGNCERTARITVEPDFNTIRLNIDLAIGQQQSVSFAFVMNREPDTPAVVYGRKQPKEKKKK